MPDSWNVNVAGTRLPLLPGKAAYWREERTLLAADVHLGKDVAFRARSVPVPLGSTASDLDRLSRLVERTGTEGLVILGDLYHAAAGMGPPTYQALRRWRDEHEALDVLFVRGNHDRDAGPSPEDLRITEREMPLAEDPFVFRHVPEPSENAFLDAGHVHTSLVVHGTGVQRERLPCFHLTSSSLTLPALGEFMGTHFIDPAPGDKVVGGDAALTAQ